MKTVMISAVAWMSWASLGFGQGSLQVSETAFCAKIEVRSDFGPGWKAVVDRQRGGVVTGFHLPADGPNLVSDDGNRFEGMFNVIYVDFTETGKDGAYVAKGALYYFGRVDRMEIVEREPDRVVVEVAGRAGNQVPTPEGDVLAYRQRYTFRPDRIECAGELDWLFDGTVEGSRPELVQLQCLFAPDAAVGEMRIWDGDTGPVTLAETNSKGRVLPEGLDYPLAVEVPLRANAYKSALRIRSLDLPRDIVQARFYWNEYPRQIDGKRGFAFKAWEGWPGNGDVRFSNSEPIRYRYEVEIVPDVGAAPVR